MSDFNVTIVEYPAKRLTGIKVRSNMAKAQEDCPALWQRFCTDCAQGMPAASFGVSVMLDAENFDYWAAVEDKDGRLPADMEHVDIPAGKIRGLHRAQPCEHRRSLYVHFSKVARQPAGACL